MNNRRASLILGFLPTIAMVCGLAGFCAGFLMWGSESDEQAQLRAALEKIEERYVDSKDSSELVDGAIHGMTRKLDPYCQYFNPDQWKEFKEQLSGSFGGVGILVEVDLKSGFLRVVTPIEDTPAFEVDILPGDLVYAVDEKTIEGLPLQEILGKIKGEPGTVVILSILREGRDPFKVKLTRRMITVKAVRSKMLDDGIGYIRITDFTQMMKQFDEEVVSLQGQGMKALVVDLRFNGGGLLQECIKLSDRFLQDGLLIVTTRGRQPGEVQEFRAEAVTTLPDIPLAILVNESTASASEVFSGAMQDHHRGVLVGTRTYGKGSVQTPFGLPGGAFLKLTTAKYFTPSGASVQRTEGEEEHGLKPDYLVEMSAEEYGKLITKWNADRVIKAADPKERVEARDYQLEVAMDVLRAKLEGKEPQVKDRVLPKKDDSGK